MKTNHTLLLCFALALAPATVWAATMSQEAKPLPKSGDWSFDAPIFEENPISPKIQVPLEPTHSESEETPEKHRPTTPARIIY